jgi:nitroreductase
VATLMAIRTVGRVTSATVVSAVTTLLSVGLFNKGPGQERAVPAATSGPDSAAIVLEVIKQRRTVRRFRSTPVPSEHLAAILDAAHYAPTAGNQQPWRFLVVRDREKLDLLKERALQWYLERVQEADAARGLDLDSLRARTERLLEGVLSAPVYVAVLVDKEAPYSQYLTQDGSLAAGNLMIAARALGYGTGFFTTFFPEGLMREFFGIPDRYSLICFTPIGVPEAWPEMPPKRPLDELVVFEERHDRAFRP